MYSSRTATNVRPWDQSPEFLAATDHVVRAGGLPYYAQGRPVGHDLTDYTEFIAGQAEWTDHNLPSILYTLHPPAGWHDFRLSPPAPPKKDTGGNLVLEKYPLPGKRVKPLRDYKILPDKASISGNEVITIVSNSRQIGTQNPWWYYEAVRRIDPRVAWNDVLMRMPRQGRRNQNALNMEGSRMRSRYHLISWHPTSDESKTNELQNEVVSRLSDEQRRANTTRGSTPGLIRPWLGEAGGRVPHPILSNGQGTCRGSRLQKLKAKKEKAAETIMPAVPNDGSVRASVMETKIAGQNSNNDDNGFKLRIVPRQASMSAPSASNSDEISRKTIVSQALASTSFPYNGNFAAPVTISDEIVTGKRKRSVENSCIYGNQGLSLNQQPTTGEEEASRKCKRIANSFSAYQDTGYGVSKGRTYRNSSNAKAQSGTPQPLRRGYGPSNLATRNDFSPLRPSISLPLVSHSQYQTTHSHPSSNLGEATRNAYPPVRMPNPGQRAHPDILSPEESEAMLGPIAASNEHAYPEEQKITTRYIDQPRSLRRGRANSPDLPPDHRLPHPGDNRSLRVSGGQCVPPIRGQNGTSPTQTQVECNGRGGKQVLEVTKDQRVLSSGKHEQPATRKRRAEHETQVPEQSSQTVVTEFHQLGSEQQFVAKRCRVANSNSIPSQVPQVLNSTTLILSLEENQPSNTYHSLGSSAGTAHEAFRARSNEPVPSNWAQEQLIGHSIRALNDLMPSNEDLFTAPSIIDDLQSSTRVQDDLKSEQMRANDPGFDFDVVQDEHFARYSSPPRNMSRPSTSSVRSD